MSDDSKKSLRCSFCGKHENQVHRMIQGPGVRICDECVQLCMSILSDGFDDEDVEPLEDMPDELPTPREIKDASERDHWMTAEEARDFGLVDKIITAKK